MAKPVTWVFPEDATIIPERINFVCHAVVMMAIIIFRLMLSIYTAMWCLLTYPKMDIEQEYLFLILCLIMYDGMTRLLLLFISLSFFLKKIRVACYVDKGRLTNRYNQNHVNESRILLGAR